MPIITSSQTTSLPTTTSFQTGILCFFSLCILFSLNLPQASSSRATDISTTTIQTIRSRTRRKLGCRSHISIITSRRLAYPCASLLAFAPRYSSYSSSSLLPLTTNTGGWGLWQRSTRLVSSYSRHPKYKSIGVRVPSRHGLTMESSTSTSTETNTKDVKEAASPEAQKFGRFIIESSHIFHRSSSSFALVNLRPIVPGHVLVVPYRVVPRLQDLSCEEYTDLWNTVRKVQQVVEKHYGASASNVAVQDGHAAGQSVPHVHVHILPRQPGDYEVNDDIYEEIEHWCPREKEDSETTKNKLQKNRLEIPQKRVDRTASDMSQEAAILRSLLDATKEQDQEQGLPVDENEIET